MLRKEEDMTYRKTVYIIGVELVMLALIGLGIGFSTTKAPTTQSTTQAWVDDDDPACGGNSPCFRTIQAAVDALSEGRVYIRPGIYREHVVLTKNVELIGSGRELVRLEAPDSTRPVILVKGTYLSGLSGLGIFGGSVGVQVKDAEVFEIAYNRIVGYTEAGIRLVHSVIRLSIAYNELPDSIRPSSGSDASRGIELDEDSHALIGRNSICAPIEIKGTSTAQIVENLLGGIIVQKEGNVSIERNQLFGSLGTGIGIQVNAGANVVISHNQVQGYAIGIQIAGEAVVKSNVILHNQNGVVVGIFGAQLPQPPRLRLLRNRIIGNSEWGLALYDGQGVFSDRAEIHNNWISENGEDGVPGEGGGIVFGSQARLDISYNWVVNNYDGICPFGIPDEETLRGSSNEIHDNKHDVCLGGENYPWPPKFTKP